jgi:hypothetical protein
MEYSIYLYDRCVIEDPHKEANRARGCSKEKSLQSFIGTSRAWLKALGIAAEIQGFRRQKILQGKPEFLISGN